MKLPNARSADILTQDLGNELLIYDNITQKAFCLNETSTIVFNACNGKTTFDDLKIKYKFNDDLIYFALDELKNNGLLAAEFSSARFIGLSRREAVKRVALSSLAILPVITMCVAPTRAQVLSLICSTPGGAVCANDAGCATVGYCGTALVLECVCVANCCVECPGVAAVNCNGICVDLNSDNLNCGACSSPCATGQTCTAGICITLPVIS